MNRTILERMCIGTAKIENMGRARRKSDDVAGCAWWVRQES